MACLVYNPRDGQKLKRNGRNVDTDQYTRNVRESKYRTILPPSLYIYDTKKFVNVALSLSEIIFFNNYHYITNV